jgi:RNA polymerase sigma-32 factor
LRSWSSVKLGTTQASRKLFFKLRSAKSEMTDAEGDAPSQQDLATELGVTTADVEEMELRLAARDFSLDAEPLDGGRAKIDALASHDDNQEERYGEEESRQQIASNVSLGLKELSDKERYIVEQRYLADEPKTLGEIGDEFGVSRERVRQLEVRAMSKLRAAMPADAASLVR